MTWQIFNTSEEVLVKELLTNIRDDASRKHCRLLITGTETPEGYAIRQTCHQPDAIAGIIATHAIRTGEVAEAVKMAQTLIRIGQTALKVMDDELRKKGMQN